LSTLVDDVKSLATLQFRISDALVRTARWVTTEKNWLRVGYVIIGGVAILAGVSAMIQSSDAGAAVVNAGTKAGRKAVNAIPAGRAAKIAQKVSSSSSSAATP
jgi:hypothetical protein